MTVVVWSIVALAVVNLGFAGGVLALRLRNNIRARRWHRLEARWYPAMLDLFAGDTTVAALLPHVEPREVVPVLEICGRLVRRVSGADRKLIQEFVRPLLPGLRPILRSRQPEKRANAVDLLSTLGTDDDFRIEVTTALADPSLLVSMVAARAVATQRRAGIAIEVLEQLDRFEMWSQTFLASMLASMGTEIAPDLRNFLTSRDHSSRARAVTAQALAQLRDLPAADVAAGLIAASQDRELTAASLRVIQAVGRTQHLGIVRPLLGHEDFVIRAHAATAIGRIGTAADAAALATAVSDDSPWVAIHAAVGLRHLGRLDILRELSSATGARAEAALEALEQSGF